MRRWALLWVALSGLLVVTACGGSGSALGTGGNGSTSISIAQFAITPASISNNSQLTVHWTVAGSSSYHADLYMNNQPAVTDGAKTILGANGGTPYYGNDVTISGSFSAGSITLQTPVSATTINLSGFDLTKPLYGILKACTYDSSMNDVCDTKTVQVSFEAGAPATTRTIASITVEPDTASIKAGQTQQFSAVAKDANNSQISGVSFTWTTSNSSAATISDGGLATGVSAGTANITASSGGVTSNQAILTVNPSSVASITITPGSASISAGDTRQFTAVAKDASNNQISGVNFTWASSNTSVATIDDSGLATGVSAGTTYITASSGGITSSQIALTVAAQAPGPIATITISPATATIAAGHTQQFTAVAKDANNNQINGLVFSWSSSSNSVASINSSGLATGALAGTTNITASSGGVTSSQVVLTVTPSTIASITVSPNAASVDAGHTQQFSAMAKDAYNNQIGGINFTWTSTNNSVATVNSSGLATGASAGTATITASSGLVSGSATLTVTATLTSIAVTPANPSKSPGTTQQFTATGTYSNLTTKNLTSSVAWSSSNTSVATVSNVTGSSGQVTSIATGTTTITASSGLISGTTILTIAHGASWTPQSSGTTSRLMEIIWTGTKFVAVGGHPSYQIYVVLSSSDGSTWTSQVSGSGFRLTSIVWTGTQYVAVGESGHIITSPDLVTWTQQVSGSGRSLSKIVWTGSGFVAVGQYGTILTSPDGVTWTTRSSGVIALLNGVSWSGSQFIAVGSLDSVATGATILTSPDGVTWTKRSTGSYINNLTSIVWTGTRFIAVGSAGSIATSSDGITWTLPLSGTSKYLYNVILWDSQYVAVGATGTILTSPDGLTWMLRSSGTTADLRAIIDSPTQAIAVGSQGNILSSY